MPAQVLYSNAGCCTTTSADRSISVIGAPGAYEQMPIGEIRFSMKALLNGCGCDEFRDSILMHLNFWPTPMRFTID